MVNTVQEAVPFAMRKLGFHLLMTKRRVDLVAQQLKVKEEKLEAQRTRELLRFWKVISD